MSLLAWNAGGTNSSHDCEPVRNENIRRPGPAKQKNHRLPGNEANAIRVLGDNLFSVVALRTREARRSCRYRFAQSLRCSASVRQVRGLKRFGRIWRRERDSNPRWVLATHAFQAC